ncbi:DNA-binding protein [Pedobacter lusitanus]|uniref:DNA-binding protein n=1 Tax=Pedobacter lusitanus TaxID=1503925 RepID=A0A0D0F5L7_9SPHI|nr:YafY family protein [Pedobacter lusitanus]KIO76848.1 DNA-binding protein [Pedobacter lusitanus]
MNRIDRLSAILIQLQSRRTVRAQDIAERFEISLRTVYRDIRSLEEAGIPIIGEAGVGYSLTDGYRLPPIMFTREEATAFITAEKLVIGLTDTANSNSYSSALYKIRAVLKSADKDHLENLDDKIEFLKSSHTPELRADKNPLQTILNAIAVRNVLQLNYFAYYRQEHTLRQIEPVGVFYLDNYWHLIAYCRERKAYRDFRFDRITEITTLSELYPDRHPSLKSYLHDMFREVKLVEVTIKVDKNAYPYLGQQKYYHGFVSENHLPDCVEMQFLTNSIEGFARWFITFADHAFVLQPEVLLDQVKNIFSGIEKNLVSR